MMESELPKDFCVGTAKTSEQQITNRRNTRTLVNYSSSRIFSASSPAPNNES
ncbi:hypothetical protein N9L38_05155 [Candidatus Poseidoniales archaeon]|nr:hypothetical protein [Candidatus Poseidoniales archaeon]